MRYLLLLPRLLDELELLEELPRLDDEELPL